MILVITHILPRTAQICGSKLREKVIAETKN